MPTFATPDPISVTVELGVGNIHVVTGDRADTVVEVRPSSPSDESDVQAAQRVRVDYANGVLQVVGPKVRMFDFSRKTRSADVTIELPSGSTLSGDVQMGDLTVTGQLGKCDYKTSTGNVRLDRTGPLRVHTAAGAITVDEVAGSADIHTSSGRVSLGDVDGSVSVKNSNGETEIGWAAADVRVRSANGSISVGRAGAGVDAKTANGGIRLGEVARGLVTLGTSMGDLEVGIAAGTAAWLEVNTGFGQVHNQLDSTDQPERSDETVKVQAHTSFGAITIRRA